MNKNKTLTPTPSLPELARKVMKKYNQNVPVAARALMREVVQYPHMQEQLLYQACYESCSRNRRTDRVQSIYGVLNQNTSSPLQSPETRVKALAAGNLMSFPLSSGVALANAKRPDILKEETSYARRATDSAAKSTFFGYIAAKLHDDKTPVRKILSEKDLKAFMAKAIMMGNESIAEAS